MSKKQLTILLVILALVVISAVIWLVWLKSMRPGNENVNQVNVNQAEGNVIASTDKSEYKLGENVIVTIKNNTKNSIYSYNSVHAIRSIWHRKEDNSWETLPSAYCEYPYCVDDIAPQEIKFGQSLSFIWDQKSYIGDIAKQVGLGIYKLSIIYSPFAPGKMYEVETNTFTIGEKSAEIIVTTDKTGYKQGEIITITITNNTNQEIYFQTGFIQPFTSLFIEQYKDGKWDTYDDAYGVAELPVDFTPNKWLEDAIALKPDEKYEYKWNGKLGDYQDAELADSGKYRVKLGYYYKQTKEITWDEFNSLRQFAYSNEFTIKSEKVDCDQFEKDIKQKIEQANDCQTKDDCVVSTEFSCPFGCPFGGYPLFNKKAETGPIRILVESYYQDCPHCEYKCMVPPTPMEIKCINNKCVWEMM